MDRTKISILFFLLLVLLLFCSMEAEAANIDSVTPIYKFDILGSGTIDSYSTNYRFIVSSDEIYIDRLGNTVSVSSDNAIFSFDTGVLFIKPLYEVSNFRLYDGYRFGISPNWSLNLSYDDNGFATFDYSNYSVLPYALIDGTKYYLNNGGFSYINISPSHSDLNVAFGCEVQVGVNFNGYNVQMDELKTYFGQLKVNLFSSQCNYNIEGYRYISTGDNAVADTNLKVGSSIIDKLDEVVKALGRDYDASGAESTNTELSNSLDSINTAEGTAMTDAKVDVGNYDTASVFNFAPAVISSLSLITTFANSFFRASGDLTTALTVLFALVFISAVVGFLRFVK